jgi:hypothetical protein
VLKRRGWPTGKRPDWPDTALPPWSEEERPSLLDVTLAYPGKALSVLLPAVLVGTWLGGVIGYGVSHILSVPGGPAAVLLGVIAVPALWWRWMKSLVRGRSRLENPYDLT